MVLYSGVKEHVKIFRLSIYSFLSKRVRTFKIYAREFDIQIHRYYFYESLKGKKSSLATMENDNNAKYNILSKI
jgi:hypothetical protein